jgi:hypothetical protein
VPGTGPVRLGRRLPFQWSMLPTRAIKSTIDQGLTRWLALFDAPI